MQYSTTNRLRRSRSGRKIRIKIDPARAVAFFIGGIVLLFILAFLTVAVMSRDLPEPGRVSQRGQFSTVFYDRNGEILFEMYKDKNRIPIEIKDVPKHLQQATIAVEDKSFYSHKGFSVPGMVRGFFNTVFRGRLAGGSTLTQQLVKNVLLTTERTVPRKIKEFVLAVEIERRFTKDEILEMYLNESPYGGTYWGVQSAAQGYFGKDISKLSLVESAILAGLPQSPSRYSPLIGEKDAYVGRTKDVLRRMREDGYITKSQEEKAIEVLPNVKFENRAISIIAPHFVFYVYDILNSELSGAVIEGGLEVYTTLSVDIQTEAEAIVKEEIEKIKDYNANNGSMVVLDSKTGEILAMVGSYDYNDENYGRYNTTTALRQPGSALKPITYAVALERGYTASTVIMDLQTEFPDQGGKTYLPTNYDGRFRGPVQMRFALGNSINIPAVKMTAIVGVRSVLQKAYDMGLTSFEPTDRNLKRFGLSITLGGGEVRLLDLTSAFSVFARGGVRIDPESIIEVKNHKGKVIYAPPKKQEKRVLTENIAFIISHILTDNNARSEAFGVSSQLVVPGNTVAVKTGTTNDKRDNLAVGFTKDVAVGVWVGNNDNSPMNPQIASGLTGASPIWNRMMRYLMKTYEDGILDKPTSVEALEIDAYLGGIPIEGVPKRSEYFVSGSEPIDIASYYKKIKISKNTGKLANDIEIRLGEYEERDFIRITESDPVSQDGKNRWQEAIDVWAQNQNDDRYKVPGEESDKRIDDVVVTITSPKDKELVNSNNITVKSKAVSSESMEYIELIVNGSSIRRLNSESVLEENITLNEGVYTIEVRARNSKGKEASASIRIGIKKPWDWEAPTTAPTIVITEPIIEPTIASE